MSTRVAKMVPLKRKKVDFKIIQSIYFPRYPDAPEEFEVIEDGKTE